MLAVGVVACAGGVQPRADKDREEEAGERQRRDEGDQQLHARAYSLRSEYASTSGV